MAYKRINIKVIEKGLKELMKLSINDTAFTLKRGGTLNRLISRDRYGTRERVAKEYIDTEKFNIQYKKLMGGQK